MAEWHRLEGGDRPAGGNRRGSVRGWPGRSDLFVGPLRRAHLLTTVQGLMVVLPDGSRAPSGGGSAGGDFPCRYIPADANGGLCIGRSCADHREAWGPRPPTSGTGYIPVHCLQQLRQSPKRGLTSVRTGAIL